jgi:hypothetical protein
VTPSGPLLTPLVTRPPALEPPATPVFGPSAPALPAIVFPELPFPPEPAPPPGSRGAEADLAPPLRPRDAAAEPDPFDPVVTPRSELPDPGAHARRLVLAALEAISGRRSVQQLRPHLTEGAYQRLISRVHQEAGRARYAAVARTGRRPVSRTRLHVGRAIVCEPADGIVEATVLIRLGSRTRAVAVRLEGLDGRWRCPVLALL